MCNRKSIHIFCDSLYKYHHILNKRQSSDIDEKNEWKKNNLQMMKNTREHTTTHLKKVLNILVIPCCCWGETPFSGEVGRDEFRLFTDGEVTEVWSEVRLLGELMDISLDLPYQIFSNWQNIFYCHTKYFHSDKIFLICQRLKF